MLNLLRKCKTSLLGLRFLAASFIPRSTAIFICGSELTTGLVIGITAGLSDLPSEGPAHAVFSIRALLFARDGFCLTPSGDKAANDTGWKIKTEGKPDSSCVHSITISD